MSQTARRRMTAAIVALCTAAVMSQGAAVHAATTVEVPAVANIFGAGHAVPPPDWDPSLSPGELPPVVAVPSGPGRVLRFSSVTGFVNCMEGYGNGPDGGCLPTGTNILSTGGISGIVDDFEDAVWDDNMWLVGVFLTDAEPSGLAPARLDFSSTALGHDFVTLAPAIGQTFFIGDGKTAGGLTQGFSVPAGATRLFLGLADAYGFADEPGTYYDNSGSFSATFTMNAPPVAVPDAYNVIGGGTLTVPAPGVLGNDTDPDNDPLTAQLVSTTTQGSLTLNPNGSFTYVAPDGAAGTDSFTYRANDGTADSAPVTVTINLQAGCAGRTPTQTGTAANNTLGGTGGNDVILGLGGNDTIEPGSGNDIVCAGPGNDTVEAGSGNDIVRGGTGNDTLDGGSGLDQLFGEAGIDRLFGGGDNDTLDGGTDTPDRCDGEGGNDTATACETILSVP